LSDDEAMEIKLRLMGSLRDRMPPGCAGRIELPQDVTLRELLTILDIPEERVQVISINSQFEHDRDRCLRENDEVTILPAVVGG
jgi:sulfur carrier protein ThiS